MSDHLPECHTHMDGYCICPALRACERRVRLDNYERGYNKGYAAALEVRNEALEMAIADARVAYDKGLSDAREAVAALPVAITVFHDTPFLNKQGMGVCENADNYPHGLVQVAALAAIDALRGESNG